MCRAPGPLVRKKRSPSLFQLISLTSNLNCSSCLLLCVLMSINDTRSSLLPTATVDPSGDQHKLRFSPIMQTAFCEFTLHVIKTNSSTRLWRPDLTGGPADSKSSRLDWRLEIYENPNTYAIWVSWFDPGESILQLLAWMGEWSPILSLYTVTLPPATTSEIFICTYTGTKR